MQASCLKQHSQGTVHRIAERVFLAPDTPVAQSLPYSLSDESLYKGNVPQSQDWLRAWRSCKTPASLKAATEFYGTDDYAAGRKCNVHRKSCSIEVCNVFIACFSLDLVCFCFSSV